MNSRFIYKIGKFPSSYLQIRNYFGCNRKLFISVANRIILLSDESVLNYADRQNGLGSDEVLRASGNAK